MSALVGQADLSFQQNLYASRNCTRRWLHSVRHEWVTKALQSLPLPSGAIGLDVGVGCGVVLRQLVQRCDSVTAIDINEHFLAFAASMGRVAAVAADIQCWRSPQLVDVAVCSEVLEHVADPAMAMRNLSASIRPGGHLVLTTPHRWSTVELTARLLEIPGVAALARLIYGEPVAALGHISLMTRREVTRIATAASMKVVAHESLGFYLPLLAETGGQSAQRLFARIAEVAGARPLLSQLLWTQCYVLRRLG